MSHTSYKLKRAGFLMLVASLWSVDVRAQTPERARADEGSIVVRGQREDNRGAGTSNVPLEPYRIVPRASAAEYLLLAPGFVLSQHGGDGKSQQIFLRGFDAQHGQDIEFNVGGLPINEVSNVHGQGYSDLNFLIPEVVDKLTVLEGPYDPRQGDFAVAGSARFDVGVAQRGVLIRLGYGMFDTGRLALVVAPRGLSKETFLAGELQGSNGFGANRASARATAMGQVGWRLGDHVQLRVMALTYAARFRSPGVVKTSDFLAGRQGFFDSNDPQQGGSSLRHAVLASLRWEDKQDRFEITTSVGVRSLRVEENFTGFLLDPRGDRFEQSYEAVTLALNGSYRHTFSIGHVEAGLAARHDRTSQSMVRLGYYDDAPYKTDVDANVNVTDIGLYVDGALSLFKKVLEIKGGVRADALVFDIDDHLLRTGPQMAPRGRRDANGIQVGPRATIELHPHPFWTISAAYGKGYRSPQALSLGQGEPAPFATVHAGEVGVRFRNRMVEASLVGFATHVDRDLVFDPVTAQNVVVGTGATTRLGGALATRLKPLPNWNISLSATYVRATFDENGFAVPYVPAFVGRLDTTYEQKLGTLWSWPVSIGAGLGVTYLGYRSLPFSQVADANAVADLGLVGRFGKFELGLTARNLTDARWRDGQFFYASQFDQQDVPSRVPTGHFTAGRPFTFLVSLSCTL